MRRGRRTRPLRDASEHALCGRPPARTRWDDWDGITQTTNDNNQKQMSKQITVRLTDDELAKQVDELADEFGSTSEVVREAIRNLSDTDDETLPDKIERADEHIRKLWSPGDTVQIETVETTIAQELQLNKGAIRRSVIRPLVDRGRLHKQQTMRNVFVTIAPEEVSDE